MLECTQRALGCQPVGSSAGRPSRITAIRVYSHDLPVVGNAYRMGLTAVERLSSTIVAIETAGGLVGYGETCPVGPLYQPHHMLGARAALAELGPHLVGEDASNLRRMQAVMDAALNGHGYAKAAIEVAAYDLAGKAAGLRVCDLLGGALRERVPSYASLPVSSPDEAVEAAELKQSEGYERIQLKVGGRSLDEDVSAIRRVADVLRPGIGLAVDANRSWTTAEAVAVSEECRDVRLLLEQPCDTYDEIVSLRGRVHHPVLMDESADSVATVSRAATQRVVDGFGLKVTRVGGLSAMRTIRDICEASNLPHTCDDSWGGDIIAAACVHIAATVRPRLLAGVWIAAPYHGLHYDPVNGIRIVDGWISVPDGPGLGVEPRVEEWGDPIASYA
jgi:4-hydroxyproline betaine 2-epimerase